MKQQPTVTTSSARLKFCSKVRHALVDRSVQAPRSRGLFVLLVLVTVLPSLAQQAAQKPPQLEVFAGYSYVRFDSKVIGFADKSNMNGWNVAASYRIFKNIGLTADVSGHYASEIQLYNFLIGPQISFPRGNMNYFGHFLIGKARDHVTPLGGDTSIGRAIVFGGGVDRTITSHFAFRVVQVDFLSTRTFATSESNLRVSTGLVYQFGGK